VTHCFSLGVPAPVVRVLDLHPAALSWPVETRIVLGGDALEAKLADGRVERAPVVERLARRPGRTVERELLELTPTLDVRTEREVDPVAPQQAKTTNVIGTEPSRFRTRRQTCGK
jgi:hypothetical protein